MPDPASDASITGADASDADFSGANLAGADLTGTELSDAIFTGASYDAFTIFDAEQSLRQVKRSQEALEIDPNFDAARRNLETENRGQKAEDR